MSDYQDRLKVLVVDDNAENLKLIGEILLDADYEVFVASCSQEALDIAATNNPDLVLLDVVMPGMDGFETCRRLKALPINELQVVFLTARTGSDALMEGFDAGGADYVTKPFEPRVLLARVRTHALLGRMNRNSRLALDQRNEQLCNAGRELIRLSRELAATEERERRQLAEGLHDGPIQDLALASIQIDIALNSDDPLTFKHSLTAGAQQLRTSLGNLRTLLFDLSPPAMTTSGLSSALQRLAQHISQQWPITVEIHTCGDPQELEEGRLLALFRASRELLINAAKHSGAKSTSLRLVFEQEQIRILVEDQGQGFDPKATSKDGFGLASVSERLAVYNGTLHIHSPPGGGTRAEARLPLHDKPNPAQQ